MALDYRNIGFVFYGTGNYDQALSYHKEALKIHQELKDRVEMAGDYTNIGIVLTNIKNQKAAAIESFSKALEIHQELEQETGYHHSLSDGIQPEISRLKEKKCQTIK